MVRSASSIGATSSVFRFLVITNPTDLLSHTRSAGPNRSIEIQRRTEPWRERERGRYLLLPPGGILMRSNDARQREGPRRRGCFCFLFLIVVFCFGVLCVAALASAEGNCCVFCFREGLLSEYSTRTKHLSTQTHLPTWFPRYPSLTCGSLVRKREIRVYFPFLINEIIWQVLNFAQL